MDSYEKINVIGEGTYGMVMKCRHKDTGQIVAIKKFKESEDDAQIRKTAMREVRVLKQLKNDNIVNLLEVFRKKGRLYLIFEHVDRTILEELDRHPHGLSDSRDAPFLHKCMYQIVKAVDYLHSHNIIHRDIKPENVLISNHGVIKLCDFGFARSLSGPGAKYTDYVATRWYRSPELLVGDTEYGKPVDVWAIACIFAELMTGQPLFPGDTDVDQLYRITKCLGPLTKHFSDIFAHNPLYLGVKLPEPGRMVTLEVRFNNIPAVSLAWLKSCLIYDQNRRASTKELLAHPYFQENNWAEKFETEIKNTISQERERLRKKRTALKVPSAAYSTTSTASKVGGSYSDQQNSNSKYGIDFQKIGFQQNKSAISSITGMQPSNVSSGHVVTQATQPPLYNFSNVSANKSYNGNYSYHFAKKPANTPSYNYKPAIKPKSIPHNTNGHKNSDVILPKI